MILIYSHKLTNRLKYSFQVIFEDILKSTINFTDNKDDFAAFDGPKICYTNQPLASGLFIQSASLLFENGITEQNINTSEFKETPCFFKTSEKSAIPFDPFAASFYLVSRYEEYLPQIRDEHDRFMAKESLAFKNGFLKLPLINIWSNYIKEILKDTYPNFEFKSQKFEFKSTLDIDNAYAYKHKGFLRIAGGLSKSIIKGNDTKQRLSVLLGKTKDPYDTFDYLFELHKKYNIQPIYFFLLGDYAINDKNIPVKNKTFQSLIKSLADYYQVGIHPSYNSNNSPEILTKEIKRLQGITHKNVTISRQHFLRLNLPETYQRLIEHDILEDYTMGYADQPGFRASITSPFYFYDLESESKTKLKVVPFCVMEATFKYYLKNTPQQATETINELISTVKNVNGTFVSVWHNESLSENEIWRGWKTVYEEMLKKLN